MTATVILIISYFGNNLAGLVESDGLRRFKGIGEALAEKIATLVKTGNLPYYEELRASVPPGLIPPAAQESPVLGRFPA